MEQFGFGEIQGLLVKPGLIAIAGQEDPEIDKRIREPFGKFANKG